MSTRCQIGFYSKKEQKIDDFEALIYRHSDGYPGKPDGTEYGVLEDIMPFLNWFAGARGISGVEYVSARLLQYLCNQYDGDKEAQIKEYSHTASQVSLEFTGSLGHGICNDFHGDIEYFYKIYPNAVEVYETEWDSKPKDWKLIETHQIVKKEKLELVK